jgi:hypothetical protein
MSRLLIDGFESGSFLGNWVVTGTAAVVSDQKKTGNYSMKVTNGQMYITTPITTTNPTIYFKLHLYLGAAIFTGTNFDFITFGNAAGPQVSVGFKSAYGRALTVTRGYLNDTILAVGAIELELYTWYLIEGKITLHGSTGIFQLKVNGVCPGTMGVDFTGNTLKQASTDFTWVRLGLCVEPSYNGTTFYMDGFVLDDTNWIGDSRVIGIAPSGAGVTTQWTPSTGNNYACVDDIPANDTDYVGINANDQVDLYSHAALPAEAYLIKSVSVIARAVKEGASTPQNLKLALNIDGDGGSPRLSNSTALSYVMQWISNIWEINPATGLAFTPAEVNATQFGIKSAA